MGPKLFSFQKGETVYSLRLLPIGGYCAMEGEDGESDNPRAFNNAKIYKRLIIIIAGAVMNIVLGLVLMMITLLPMQSFASTQVSTFGYHSYTQQSGLKRGDVIKRINGYDVLTSTDFSFAIYTIPVKEVDGHSLTVYREDCMNALCDCFSENVDEKTDETTLKTLYKVIDEGIEKISLTENKEDARRLMCEYIDSIYKTLGKEKKGDYPKIEEKDTRQRFRTDMIVERNGENIELKDVDFLTTVKEGKEDPVINLDFYVQPIEKNIGTLITQTFSNTVSVVRMVYASLWGLVTGRFGLNEMSGPVGLASAITTVAGESLQRSFLDAVMSIVYVMMVITVNLGIVNMLPFPALDGGRFLFLIIEWVFKKPIPRKVESIVNAVGLVLLLALMAVITVKDVWQLFNGGFNV